MMNALLRPLALLGCLLVAAPSARAETETVIGYLGVAVPLPPTLSNLDPVPEDDGLAGARTGLSDNRTTGRFLGQSYDMLDRTVAEGDDPPAAARAMLAETPYLVIDAPAAVLTAIADLPEASDALLFNVTAPDRALRDGSCRANLLHTAASLAMRTDALAQLLVRKRWGDLAMIAGTHPPRRRGSSTRTCAATRRRRCRSSRRTWAGTTP